MTISSPLLFKLYLGSATFTASLHDTRQNIGESQALKMELLNEALEEHFKNPLNPKGAKSPSRLVRWWAAARHRGTPRSRFMFPQKAQCPLIKEYT